MRPQTGLLLRMLGPLIEILCVAGLLSTRGQGRTIAGMPLDYLFYAGLALGLGMVIAGLTLVRRPRRVERPTED
jgi:hypothetical protein